MLVLYSISPSSSEQRILNHFMSLVNARRTVKKEDEKILLTAQKVSAAYKSLCTRKSPMVLMNIKELAVDPDFMNTCVCPVCGENVVNTWLRNHKAWREFKISAMCQECQDNVFSTGE